MKVKDKTKANNKTFFIDPPFLDARLSQIWRSNFRQEQSQGATHSCTDLKIPFKHPVIKPRLLDVKVCPILFPSNNLNKITRKINDHAFLLRQQQKHDQT